MSWILKKISGVITRQSLKQTRLVVERALARARRPGPEFEKLSRAFVLAREPK